MQVNIACVKHMISNKMATMIDSRDKEDFDQGHIPTAINIPYNSVNDGEMDVIFMLEDFPRDSIYIVYCGGKELKCDLSFYLTEEMLGTYNFSRVLLYEGGWAEWLKSSGGNDD